MKLVQDFQIIELLCQLIERIGPDFFWANALEDDFRLLGVVPKFGLVRDAFFVFYFRFLAIVVKDTSVRRRRGLLSLSGFLRSWIKNLAANVGIVLRWAIGWGRLRWNQRKEIEIGSSLALRGPNTVRNYTSTKSGWCDLLWPSHIWIWRDEWVKLINENGGSKLCHHR